MKRVWCLYRVSTDKQLYKDGKGEADIPMQKRACHNFIEDKKDWKIVKEISAKGISGWKTETKDRDDLTEIKKGSEDKAFDILLVFTFDRIGRREDETPFVVEFLINHGIEVWSVDEGRREIKTHTDKLMNYIGFWGSAGVSLKISENVRNAYATHNEAGRYISGQPPYGYQLYDTQIPHHKIKNKTMLGLKINPEEAEMIKVIFDVYVNKGLGGVRLSEYLNNETSFERRNSNPFTGEQINKIIRNPIYIGKKAYNKENKPKEEWKLQDYNEEWQIVSEDIWNKAQKLADQRKNKRIYEPLPTHSQLLLSGLVFCHYCGAKLSVSHSYRNYTVKSGEVHKSVMKRYACQNAKYKHFKDSHECTMFGGKKYDEEVVSILKATVRELSKLLMGKQKEGYADKVSQDKKKELKKLQRREKETISEYEVLKKELPKVLLGKSKFSTDMISELINEREKDLENIHNQIIEMEEEMQNSKDEIIDTVSLKRDMDNWDETFDNADHDSKKMMIARLVNKIYLGKDKIDIDLNENVKALLERFGGVFTRKLSG